MAEINDSFSLKKIARRTITNLNTRIMETPIWSRTTHRRIWLNRSIPLPNLPISQLLQVIFSGKYNQNPQRISSYSISSCKAMSIGSRSQSARTYLEKVWEMYSSGTCMLLNTFLGFGTTWSIRQKWINQTWAHCSPRDSSSRSGTYHILWFVTYDSYVMK